MCIRCTQILPPYNQEHESKLLADAEQAAVHDFLGSHTRMCMCTYVCACATLLGASLYKCGRLEMSASISVDC